jgi:hypothetical protein
MAKRGRPTKFTKEVLDEILDLLAEGHSERSIFRLDHMPTWQAWARWKRINFTQDSEYFAQYAQARATGLLVWEDEIRQRARDDSRDLVTIKKSYQRKDGEIVELEERKRDNTAVQRDSLIVGADKWLMSKMYPKKYGEKVEQQLTGKDGSGLQVVVNVREKKQEES